MDSNCLVRNLHSGQGLFSICIIFRSSFITPAMMFNEMMMISVMANGLKIRFHILEGLNDTSFSPFLYV